MFHLNAGNPLSIRNMQGFGAMAKKQVFFYKLALCYIKMEPESKIWGFM